MVSHLIHIDGGLAATVADGLGMGLPKPAVAARPVRTDLDASDALSIVKRGPPSFAGRKLGLLLTDGADAGLFNALVAAAGKAGAVYEVVAPKIGGVTLSDGTAAAAKQKIDGGPSVLFDAVVILASEAGAALLAGDAAAKDFLSDAFNHCKFIGYSAAVLALFEKAGLAADIDEGCIEIGASRDARAFVDACAALRHWNREMKVDLDAKAGPAKSKKRPR
jgi:catalase